MIKNIAYAFLVIALLFCPVSADYTLQVQALTNSPTDGATVYLGVAPSAPVSTVNISIQTIPVAGWLNTTEIYDFSGTAGTNQAYSYYVRVNNTQDYLVNTLSVATAERVFSNTSMGIQVFAGDFFEIKRIQPTWTTNPLTNIVGGYVLIDTPDETDRGYPIYGMALSNSPADGATNYMGTKPAVPETVEGRNKIFIPTAGSLTQGHINDYSGTAGTAEAISYSMDVNSTDHLVEVKSVSANNRFFDNSTMNIPVQVGNYLEFKRLNPTWVTNPLTNVIGGTAWINTTDIHNINDGYPIHTFALTHTPGDAQTTYFGDLPIAPSTTAGTNKIYIRQDGRITKAGVYSYSGTAGSAETWSMYIRVNNAQDYLIQSLNLATNERMWINTSMSIPVVAGDYVEIKSVTSTMATNPATTIYGGGFYMEYEDELPTSIFETNTTYGTSPLAVQFTEALTLDPTAWEWYWTRAENSTTFKFSTIQNPVSVFDSGHYQISLNVTNASGYRYNASDVVISTSASGGYNGFTQQDIYLTGQYTITFNVKSSTTNLPISNVTVVDSVSGQSYPSTNGTAFLTLPAGLYYINFIADGYQSKQVTYVVDQDETHEVKMVPVSPSTPVQQNTWWTPHTVQITLMDASYGFRLTDVRINATYNESAMPTSWVTELYGILAQPGADVVNNTLVLGGTTGSDGTLTTTMLGSLKYDIYLTSETYGLDNYHVQAYPSDSMLNIYVVTEGTTLITNKNSTYTGLNGTRVYITEPDIHNVSMCIDYIDTTGNTNYVNDTWLFQSNNTVFHTSNFTPGAALNTSCYTLPNVRGTAVWWGWNASRVMT